MARRSWFGRSREPEKRATPAVSISSPGAYNILVPGDDDPRAGDGRYALQLSAFYRGVALVAGSIASLPLGAWREGKEGTRVEVKGSIWDAPGGTGDDLRQTKFEWVEQFVVSLLCSGDAIYQRIKNGAGEDTRLHYIPSANVRVEWDDDAVGGRGYYLDGDTRRYDAREIFHVMNMSLDGLRGIGVIGLARRGIRAGLAGDQTAGNYLKNGPSVAAVASPDPEADGDLWEVDEAAAIERDLNSMLTGSENSGKIRAINRFIKLDQWHITPQDAQFLESRKFGVEEIARWLGVPPHLLGLTEKTTSWGQGIAEQNRGLARYTLQPLTQRAQQRMSLLVKKTTTWVEFDYSQFVEPSPEDKIKLILAELNGGLITLNMARSLMNMEPADGVEGDVTRLPAGMITPRSEEPIDKAMQWADLLSKIEPAVTAQVISREDAIGILLEAGVPVEDVPEDPVDPAVTTPAITEAV